jgi:hypothetical protein
MEPRAAQKLKATIARIYDSQLIGPEEIDSIFLYTRQILEINGQRGQSKHLTLLCDLIVHGRDLDRQTKTLQSIAENFLVETRDGSSEPLALSINFNSMLRELFSVFEANGIDNIFGNMQSLEALAISILSQIEGLKIKCSIDPLDADKNVKEAELDKLRISNDFAYVISVEFHRDKWTTGLAEYFSAVKLLPLAFESLRDRGYIYIRETIAFACDHCGSSHVHRVGESDAFCSNCGKHHEYR